MILYVTVEGRRKERWYYNLL